MVLQLGLEPRLTGPKPAVLPLNDRRLWCQRPDLNQGPLALQASALPTELRRHIVNVEMPTGFEPVYVVLQTTA